MAGNLSGASREIHRVVKYRDQVPNVFTRPIYLESAARGSSRSGAAP